jgi:hypothetical protein
MANQADLRVCQRAVLFCYKNLRRLASQCTESSVFRRAEASLPQLNSDHKSPTATEFRGRVLNVPLSSAICG